MFSRIINSRLWQRRPTFWWEYLVAGSWLALVTAISTDWTDGRRAAAQVLTALAVMGTFGHMSVGSRLEEAQHHSEVVLVHCYRKMTYFLVIKEVLWLLVFLLMGNWPAIAGIPLFLLYPAWRRHYLANRSPKFNEPLDTPTVPQ